MDRGGGHVLLRKMINSFGSTVKDTVQQLTRYQPFPMYENPKNPDWLLLQAILLQWVNEIEGPVLIVPMPLYHTCRGNGLARCVSGAVPGGSAKVWGGSLRSATHAPALFDGGTACLPLRERHSPDGYRAPGARPGARYPGAGPPARRWTYDLTGIVLESQPTTTTQRRHWSEEARSSRPLRKSVSRGRSTIRGSRSGRSTTVSVRLSLNPPSSRLSSSTTIRF